MFASDSLFCVDTRSKWMILGPTNKMVIVGGSALDAHCLLRVCCGPGVCSGLACVVTWSLRVACETGVLVPRAGSWGLGSSVSHQQGAEPV